MYYSEKIVKNTAEREDYCKTLTEFIFDEKRNCDNVRGNYISPDKLVADNQKYRDAFINVLGFPLTLKAYEIQLLKKEYVATDKNVKIYRIQFLIFKKIKFYGLFFEQIKTSKDVPFVIGLHGGEGTPELVSSIYMNSANYNHLVRRITDKGANVFVPQLLLWNKTTYGNEYERLRIDGKLRQLGGSVTALELSLLENCITYFIDHKIAKPGKIGVAGMSYGGMYALHLASVDTRVTSCFSCSWVEDSFNVSWADWSYKDACKCFTSVEVCGLVAPRRLVVEMGNKDELFRSDKTIETCERVKEYYKCFNNLENFKLIVFDGNHEVDKNDEGLQFFFEGLL
jgi:hypothetical protein